MLGAISFSHRSIRAFSESKNGDTNSPSLEEESTYRMNGYSSSSGYRDMLEERGTFFQKFFGPRAPASEEENEDGWGEMRKKDVSLLNKVLKLPIKASRKLLKRTKKPGTLILIRHGQSVW